MKKNRILKHIFTILSLWIFTEPAITLAQTEAMQTVKGVGIKVEALVSGLNHPWGMAFLSDGRMLITERNTGNLYVLGTDHTLSAPLEGVPEVWAHGQGGLMDVALDPDFSNNQYIYLSYAKPGESGKATTALGRGTFTNGRIRNFRDIFVQEPYINGPNHFGNRITFSPDGRYLFFALGERFQFDPAQDLSNHLGTVIRIYPDGRVPEDNPFVGRANSKDEIWSYGHRNIEAMAIQPETGVLWIGEMGPKGGDELNQIEKGANYGWPVVSWGDHYDGRDIPDPPTRPEFKDAAIHWTPVISPSGMVFYEADLFSGWKNSALIGGLTHKELVRVVFDGNNVREEDRLPLPERIRDVDTGPDGSIYVLTDEDNGKLWRISPLGKNR
ncbi:MAG: PQQ-dependent sugar dehydrogenase [Syntrophales bacterium]|jgi:glucose/arabinose dehydrogenase|nr:PQQ-dependent sugar dehydrogenase [Syntrophales bacterium]MDY0044941.1 PQQ-dependent sugar dehydrogenase [Syntrophales bacterium]